MEEERIVWLDALRVIAGFMVVLIHCTTDTLFNDSILLSSNWHAANFYNSIARWSVPAFVMISGYLFLSKQSMDYRSFIVTHIKKLSKPLLFWTLVYSIFNSYNDLSTKAFKLYIKKIINGTPADHLWYLYMLTGLYLFIPLIQYLIKKIGNKHLSFLLIFTLFLSFSISTMGAMFFKLTMMYTVPYIPFFFWFCVYLAYLIGGYYLGKLKIKIPIIISITIIVLSVYLILFLFRFGFQNNLRYISYWSYSFYGPIVTALSFTIFNLFKQISLNKLFFRIISFISPLSLGIYLLHPLIIDIQRTYKPLPIAFINNKWFSIPLNSILIFILSLLFIYILKKIPILKQVV